MKEKIEEYLDFLRYEKNYSHYTIENYEKDLFLFKSYIEKECIDFLNIEYSDVRLFFNYLDSLKYSKSSISRKVSSIRSFYKYLSRKNLIRYNPFELISSPKKDKRLPKFLYYNELECLFNVPDLTSDLGVRNRLLLEILYATGMRVGELEYLKVSDINMSEKEIKVLGKGNKERIVFFDETAKKYLLMYLEKSRNNLMKKPCDYLLLNNNGTRLSARGIRLILDNIIKQSSIDVKASPHTLRHTFATHLLNAGCDILSVQELLGHESLRATQIYTHITNEELRQTYLKAMPKRNIK